MPSSSKAVCIFTLFRHISLFPPLLPKTIGGVLKINTGNQSLLSWRVNSEREVTFIPTYSLFLFYFILFFFYQASPKGLIICRVLWREKAEHCPYHLLPESGRVIGLCKAKWSPVWWLLIKNWLCHIKEELKVKMMIASLSQGPCTISFIQPWKVLSE